MALRKFQPHRRKAERAFTEEDRIRNKLIELEKAVDGIINPIVQSDITDVSASAGEVSLLDLGGMELGDVLSATAAATASWKRPSSIRAIEIAVTPTYDVGGVMDVSTSFSTAYVFLIDDDSIGGPATAALPTAVGLGGRWMDIKKLGTSGIVTIDPDGSETIDGESSIQLLWQFESVTLFSDDANWNII